MVYTQLPIEYHLLGLPEVIIQTMLFSLAVVFWYKKPAKAWNIIMAVFVVLIVLMSLAGVFLS
jgi:hypothetical protein